MHGGVASRFGPFEFDHATGHLFRDGTRLPLSRAQSAILHYLLTHPGVIVSKETLMDEGWKGTAVIENSVGQSILRIRKVLGNGHSNETYIETLPGKGYRFIAAVQQVSRLVRSHTFDTQLAPFRAFMQARMALDTLDRDEIRRTRRACEDTLREEPDYVPAHIDLALACGLMFEATTADPARDTASLEVGIRHAHRACELASESGEAWATLAFLLHLRGETADAAAAGCRAMAMAPDDWRVALLTAFVSWGDQRLRAARRALKLYPGLALAHWLCATVYIARGALEAALEEIRLGCAAQDAQPPGGGLPGVGLHLQCGQVLAALDRPQEAIAEFTRELQWADSRHVYGRLSAANTSYWLGAVLLRQRKRPEADVAFARALAIAPLHVQATAALKGQVVGHGMDAALGQAIVFTLQNRHADAARIYRDGAAQMPPGPAGCLLPVEPILNPLARRDIWSDALAVIRARAT